MATSKTISAALKLVESKKQNLKKAYDDLQSHYSLLSSFSPSWPDLDSHFTTLHNTLSQRFIHLQTLESQLHQNHNDPSSSPSQLHNPNPKNQNFSSIPNDPSSSSNHTTHLEALTAFCKNGDGKGLRTYIGDNFKDKEIIKDEIQIAFKSASNPADMVLDAIEGVFVANAVIDGKEPRFIKKSFHFLFQQLRFFSPFVSFAVRKKAKRLFNEWKVSMLNENPEPSWAMAFLQFVAVYGFLSELNLGELAAYCASASASASDDLPDLYQIIALSDRVQGVIQKLIERSKHILAVKYIFHFKLTDKMPPVPILKAFVDDAQKLAKRLDSEGKSLNEIRSREIHALKSVIKVIESYNLDSEFPRASIEQRIDELNKQRRVGGKTSAPGFAAKPPLLQQQQLSGIKRPLTAATFSSATSTIHQYQQPHFQPTSLLPEHPNPYTSLPPAPFGMNSPTRTVPSYTVSSTTPYGLDGVSMAPNGNLNQSVSHPNSSQQPLVMLGYYASMGSNSNLGQGGSHPNPPEPRVMPGYYTPMSSGGNLDQGSSHPNPSASGGYGLQHYYRTPYSQ